MPSSRRRSVWAPQMVSSTLGEDTDLDREIDAIVKLLKEKGPLGAPTIRRELETRFWGPGRLRARPGGGAQARAGAPDRDAYVSRPPTTIPVSPLTRRFSYEASRKKWSWSPVGKAFGPGRPPLVHEGDVAQSFRAVAQRT